LVFFVRLLLTEDFDKFRDEFGKLGLGPTPKSFCKRFDIHFIVQKSNPPVISTDLTGHFLACHFTRTRRELSSCFHHGRR
jgi:hypothetical protein